MNPAGVSDCPVVSDVDPIFSESEASKLVENSQLCQSLAGGESDDSEEPPAKVF